MDTCSSQQPLTPQTYPSSFSSLQSSPTSEPVQDDNIDPEPLSFARSSSPGGVASSCSTACRSQERSATLRLFMEDDSDMSHALINGLTGYLEHPTKQWTAEIIDNYPEHDSQGRISCTFYPESLRLENDDYDDDDDKNNENNENNENNDSDRPAARRCLCHANMHSP